VNIPTLKTWLYENIAELVGAEPEELEGSDSLYDIGLQSITLMQLIDRAHGQMGVLLSYADAIEAPTLDALVKCAEEAGVKEPETEQDASKATQSAPREDESFALSIMGHAYWAGRQDMAGNGGVPAHFYHEFTADRIDASRLDYALGKVFERHPMLRARVDESGRQHICDSPAHPTCTVHDFSTLSSCDEERAYEAFRSGMVNKTMDISKGEVFDVHLVHRCNESSVLAILLDMGVSDARSFRTVLGELAHYYVAPNEELPAVTADYRTYIARLAQPSEQDQRDRAWWSDRLDSLPDQPRLPLASSGKSPENRSYRLNMRLSTSEYNALDALARREGVTLTALLMTLFGYVVQNWSENDRFILNVPVFSRPTDIPGINDVVGDFTGSVLVDVDIDSERPWRDALHSVHHTLAEALSHHEYPGVKVLRDLSKYRGEPARASIVFTSAMGIGELFSEEFRANLGEPTWITSHSPYTALDVQLSLVAGALHVNWDVRAGVLAPGVPEAMFDAFRRALSDAASGAAPAGEPLAVALPAAQGAARAAHQAALDAAAEGRSWAPGLLQDAFLARAAEDPAAPAVAGPGAASATRGELAAMARAAAAALGAAGVEPGSRVGVCAGRGASQVACAYGALLAGCAYVPLSPTVPEARRARIAERAGLSALLCDSAAPWWGGAAIAAPRPGDEAPAGWEPPAQAAPAEPAYVIFTSGSTGEPKGVVVSHAAALNTIRDVCARFQVGPSDVALAVSGLDFDLSVFDLFGVLGAGGSLAFCEQGPIADPARWTAAAREAGATVWNSSPAQMTMALDAGEPGLPPTLRLALLSGDWVPADSLERVRRWAPGATVAALGGATEAAIWSNVHVMDGSDAARPSVPYGAALTGQRMEVAGPGMRARPDLVPGEIVISGAGLAEGYLGRDDLTAAAFVEGPGGERWYRTGDVGRWLPCGEIEFLGRRDTQVKIRGNRIEVAEVEATINAHPKVERSRVVILGEKSNRSLGAAVITKGDLSAEELVAHQKPQLPSAAVCHNILFMPAFPITHNGKIDMKQLKAMLEETRSNASALQQAPETEAEKLVASIWESVLDIDAIGRDESFFDIGGDSLSGTKVLAALRAQGKKSSLVNLFEHPTLQAFALTLEEASAPQEHATLEAGAPDEPFELTQVQKAYLYGQDPTVELGGISCTFYRAYHIANLDEARLEAALGTIVKRHAMLRMRIDDGKQRYDESVTGIEIERFDSAAHMHETLGHRTFDLACAPLMAVGVAKDANESIVGIAFCNIAIDAASVLMLLREISAAYHGESLPSAPGIEFRDYMLNRTKFLEDRAEADLTYWRDRTGDMPKAPELPLLRSPETMGAPRFSRMARTLDAATSAQLEAACRAHGSTVAALLFALYGETLRRYSASQGVTITVTAFDREPVHPDIDRVIGDFTKLVLSSYTRNASESWEETLRATTRNLLADLDHCSEGAMQHVRSELFQQGKSFPVVFTAALGLERNEEHAGLFSTCVHGLSQTPQTWLDCQVSDFGGDGITVTWDHVKGLFPEGFLEDAFDYFWRTLEWCARESWDGAFPEPTPARVQAPGARSTHCLHELVWSHAQATPDAIAIRMPKTNESVTYGQLAHDVRVARTYLASRNVQQGDRVVVCCTAMRRRIAFALALFCEGAVYVPVSSTQNGHRIHQVIEQSGARQVIDDETMIESDGEPETAPQACDPNAMAYIIFTSGTTGTPKGIAISHSQAMTTIEAVLGFWQASEAPRTLAVSSPDFDLSIFDIFGTLSAGGTIVALDGADNRDSQTLARTVQDEHVTLWNSVPQLLQMTIASAEAGQLQSLRMACVSGDKVPLDMPKEAKQAAPMARFIAMGGATEAAIWSNWFAPLEETAWEQADPRYPSVPYGHALPGQGYEVLAPATGETCPHWTIGELAITGAGVGMDYVTGEDGFFERNGVRTYRTGDMGRIRPSGIIEIRGRSDSQVKVGGHRIELGELESFAESLPFVGRAVAGITSEGKLGLALEREWSAPKAALPPCASFEPSSAGEAYLSERQIARILSQVLERKQDVNPEYRPLVAVWQQWLEDHAEAANNKEDAPQSIVDDLLRLISGEAGTDVFAGNPFLDFEEQMLADPASRAALALASECIPKTGAVGMLAASERVAHAIADGTSFQGVPGPNVDCVCESLQLDCLIAPFSMHRFDTRQAALGRAASALREDGVLVVAEIETLSPAAMISAVALSRGALNPYATNDDASTICSAEAWMNDAATVGLVPTALHRATTNDAYVICFRKMDAAPLAHVHAFLRDHVPASHIPAHLSFIDTLPLSRNGKVDRKRAMAALDRMGVTSETREETETERRLEAIWCEALGIDSCNPDASFFELGGDSLTAARVARIVRTRLDDEFSLRDFLEAPSIAAAAALVDEHRLALGDFDEGEL